MLRKEVMPWHDIFLHHLTWFGLADLKFLPTFLFIWMKNFAIPEWRSSQISPASWAGSSEAVALILRRVHIFDFCLYSFNLVKSLWIWSRLSDLSSRSFFFLVFSGHWDWIRQFFFVWDIKEDWSSCNMWHFQGNLLGSFSRSSQADQVVPWWHLRCSSWKMVESSEPHHEG